MSSALIHIGRQDLPAPLVLFWGEWVKPIFFCNFMQIILLSYNKRKYYNNNAFTLYHLGWHIEVVIRFYVNILLVCFNMPCIKWKSFRFFIAIARIWSLSPLTLVAPAMTLPWWTSVVVLQKYLSWEFVDEWFCALNN